MRNDFPAPAQLWLRERSDTELAFVWTCRRRHLLYAQRQLINAEVAARGLDSGQLEALVQATMGKKFQTGCTNCGSDQWLRNRECPVCGHVKKPRGEGHCLPVLPELLCAILEGIFGG